MSLAASAVSSACTPITSCVPGVGPFVHSHQGVDSMAVATVTIGSQCGMGHTVALTAKRCEDWFFQFVNAQLRGRRDGDRFKCELDYLKGVEECAEVWV
jgi:hypothetical protein